MTSESFRETRKRVFGKHRRSIVKSAVNGYKKRGRGLVLVELTDAGRMEHLSYLTLDKLQHRQINSNLNDRDYRAMLIDKTSTYSPGSEVLVMITDGEYQRLLVGSKPVTH
jgi:hypothetical protein